MNRDDIRNAVLRAVETTRQSLLDESALPEGEMTVLLGDGAALDSMDFVYLVVAVEEEMSRMLERPFHFAETLTKPDGETQPFRTVGQLIDFLYRQATSSSLRSN
jgi:acyl carrier protein